MGGGGASAEKNPGNEVNFAYFESVKYFPVRPSHSVSKYIIFHSRMLDIRLVN